MLSCREALWLPDSFHGDIVLVPLWLWYDLRHEGGYQEVDRWRAIRVLSNQSGFDLVKLRGFAADRELRCYERMSPMPMSDYEIRSIIIRAIEDRRIIAVEESASPAARRSAKTAPNELNRLIEQIERMGRLTFQGREYALMVATSIEWMEGRHRYEVVPQAEAREVLVALAKGAPGYADALREAGEKIGKDWRPSSGSGHEGLVLLRLKRESVFSTKPDDGPAITPSQMKALLQKDWIEIEVFDQDDEPYPTHYRLELPDSAVREGDIGEDGLVAVSGILAGSCKLDLGETKPARE